MADLPTVTTPSLSRVPALAVGSWPLARVLEAIRAVSGALLAVSVGGLALVVGPGSAFDPALGLLLAVIAGAALGGVRAAVVGTAVVLAVALAYYAQPPLVGSPGNGARVLMLIVATLAGGWLVGSLRDVADRLRPRAAQRNRAAERFQRFSAVVAEAADDVLHDTLVRETAALVDADMAVLTVINPRTGQHVVRAACGTTPAALGVEVLPGIGITGQALRDRGLVVAGGSVDSETPNGLAERLLAYLPSKRLRAADEARNATPPSKPLAATACLHAGRVSATLTVGRSRHGRPFDDDERLALAMAAPTVGLSVANWLLRRQLRESSLRDPLTGLYNRAYLDAALDQLLALRRRSPPAERKPLSLILFDLDDFRAFNEAHGRKTGDAVVRAISALLRGRFRQSDLVARISGDGFLAVLDGADAEVCAHAAGEIRRQVQALALADERGQRVQISISAGCATFRDEAERADAIIRAVEAALDTARWSGPGAIVAI